MHVESYFVGLNKETARYVIYIFFNLLMFLSPDHRITKNTLDVPSHQNRTKTKTRKKKKTLCIELHCCIPSTKYTNQWVVFAVLLSKLFQCTLIPRMHQASSPFYIHLFWSLSSCKKTQPFFFLLLIIFHP